MNKPTGEETIFAEALCLPPDERAAYLARSTNGNVDLRRRVESLLGSHQAGDFLEQAAAPQLRPTLHITVPFTEKPGDRIGSYKLLQQIGEGGCGVVYMAEQAQPVRRRVALKIIKLGMDTKSVIARFEAERQALAMMDHPNIAKIFDAGATEAGRPYFVMELVRGMKITDYCDEAKLSTRARLDLFIQVCQAIQHAHQKGIIHRDIKPSNVLVTINDGVPVPKVIDFGIAKATSGQQLTDKTLFTAFEQFIGTPAYMSPEQAVLTSLDIDTRSDIYALGVLLYEMLTGKTPFDGNELLAIGLDEMRRTIREQEPPKPSTRLSTLPGQELSTTAQRRGLDAQKLFSELRGDLDWIVMKCLEKDRARRYETANGLANDLERHLAHEPVTACPPSKWYRLQKWIQRNRLAFGATSAVGASLMIGLTLSTLLFFRERAARERANEEGARAKEQAAIAQTVNDFLQDDLLSQASSYRQAQSRFKPDPNLTVREALERAAKRIGYRFKNHPLQEAQVRHTIGSALRAVGEAEQAIPHLQTSLELARARMDPNHPNTLATMNSLASAYLDAGKLDQALPLYEQTLKLMKSSLGPTHSATLGTMNNLAMAYEDAGKLDQALPLFEATLKLRKAKLGPENRETLNAMNNLADAYRKADRIDQALPLYEQTLKLMMARFGPDDPFTQNPMFNLAQTYRAAGKLDQALPLFEEVLKLRRATMGSNHRDTLFYIWALAEVYQATGKPDQAIPLYEETLKLQKARLGPDHRDTLMAMNNLGLAYLDTGKVDQALWLNEETLKLRKAKLGPDDPYTLGSMNNLASAYRVAGKLDLALPLFEETVKLSKAKLGPENRETLGSMVNLAMTYRDAGKLDQALPLFEETLKLMKLRLRADDPYTLIAKDNLAVAYDHAGKEDQALPLFEETLKLAKAKLGPDHLDTLRLMSNLAGAFANVKNFTEAEPLYRDALNRLRTPFSNAPPRAIPILGVILHHLADVLRERKMPGEARTFAEEAMTVYDRHADWPADERRHTLEVLEAVLKDLGDSRALKAVRLKRVEALRAAAENDDVDALNRLAWLLAACSDSDIRDGRSAVGFAEKAVAKTARKDSGILDTLAVAYAEVGEFAKAADVQNEAIALLHDVKEKKHYATRLKLYESNTPYRDP